MGKKGFIATYILYLFVVFMGVYVVLLQRIYLQTNTLMHLEKVYYYNEVTRLIISRVRCALKNQKPLKANETIHTISYRVFYHQQFIDITIDSPINAHLRLTIENNEIVHIER